MSLSDHKYTDAIESGIWGSHGQEEESQVCKGLLDRIPIVNLLLVGGVGKGGVQKKGRWYLLYPNSDGGKSPWDVEKEEVGIPSVLGCHTGFESLARRGHSWQRMGLWCSQTCLRAPQQPWRIATHLLCCRVRLNV